jgi:hypothetical protein
MFMVKLFRRDEVAMPEVGTLEFFGTPIAETDGSSWLAFETDGQPCAGQVRVTPAGIATGPEVGAVAGALCRNEVRGEAGRYAWVLT